MTEYKWSGLFPGYKIGSDGSVVNMKGRKLKTGSVNGYSSINLQRDGRGTKTYVHILVCDAFHGPRPAGHEVAHLNGVRDDNRAENLRWATRAENHHDKRGHGTHIQGEDIPWAKLTEDNVREIKSLPHLSTVELGRRYNVNPSAIWFIRSGRNWKHVK